MTAARANGLTVGLILEPYPGRAPAGAASDVAYARGLGVEDVYVDEVLGEDMGAWAAANRSHTGVRIFGHSSDAGGMRSGAMQLRARLGGFDGVFTYDPLAYAPSDYAAICAQARSFDLACAPFVSPGFEARRATGATVVRDRASGVTYDLHWAGALDAAPDVVTVTSYNEWHEGKQIEPARPRRCLSGGFCYADYEGAYGRTGAAAGGSYLERTAMWVGRLAD